MHTRRIYIILGKLLGFSAAAFAGLTVAIFTVAAKDHVPPFEPDTAVPAAFDVILKGPVGDSPEGHTPYGVGWLAILNESGIPIKVAQYPQGRRRRMFVDGLIILDCCFSPEWRNRPEEQEVQLFTDSFYETIERYMFKKGHVVPITSPVQLRDFRFAGIRGYTYTHEEHFGEILYGRNVADVLRLIETGRATIGSMSETEFHILQKKRSIDVELGDIYTRAKMHARVHISRADLLPRLNSAIARLKKSGRLKTVIENGSLD